MIYILYLIINNTIKPGKGPPRYETAHQIGIKKNRNNKINELRRMNKYEVEYNMILKYFQPHKAPVNSYNVNVLGYNQHGGQRNHQDHNVTTINKLILE